LLKEVTPTMGQTQVKVTTAVLAAVLLVAGAVAATPRPPQSSAALASEKEIARTAPNKAPSPGAGVGKPGTAADMVDVSGRVLDPDGKSVVGAEITAWWHYVHSEDTARPSVKTTSGQDGRFRLRFSRSDLGDRELPPSSPNYHFAQVEIVAA